MDLYINALSEFNAIKDYYNVIMSNSLQIMINERKRIAIEVAEDKSLREFEEEIYMEFENQFNELTKKATIIGLFNTIENTLRNLMVEIKNENNLCIGYNSFVGSILEKAKLYFLNYKLKFIKNSDLELINEIQKIRDCYVHCNGRVDESRDKKYIETLCRNSDKYFNVDGILYVEGNYLYGLIEKSSNIVLKLYNDNGFSE